MHSSKFAVLAYLLQSASISLSISFLALDVKSPLATKWKASAVINQTIATTSRDDLTARVKTLEQSTASKRSMCSSASIEGFWRASL